MLFGRGIQKSLPSIPSEAGIGRAARIVHFTAVDSPAERKRALETLVELAAGNNPGDCFDDEDAADLLRRQSSAGELRELGVSEELIAIVFPEDHER